MRDRCLVIALIMVLIGLPSWASGEEFAGKLERVDRDSITVRGGDDQRLVARVDGNNRLRAAPFLGKSVTVYLSHERGECRALGLKGSR